MSTQMQEENIIRLRAKLLKNIKNKKSYNEINQFIDSKIKYDQRFFQEGYAEFQLMMSDYRKQIRLNEEVIRLKA